MSKFTYNQCKVCGGDLIHNQETGKYICKYCGNQYTLNENNVLQQITVKDLDDQRTKIVDDIKGVINDTYIKDKKEINTLIEERNQKVEKKQARKKMLKSFIFWPTWGFLALIDIYCLLVIIVGITRVIMGYPTDMPFGFMILFIGLIIVISLILSFWMIRRRKNTSRNKEI